MRFAEIGMTDKRAQRRRIVITAIAVGAIAIGFYIAAFIRFL
jgi:hypothetical protein